jgi:ribonuclease P protein component
VRTPYFLLKVKNNFERAVRIGIVVGIAVHKSAVKRNFWKRQAKTALAAGGVGRDFLLLISPKVNELTKKQFRERLSEAMKDATK